MFALPFAAGKSKGWLDMAENLLDVQNLQVSVGEKEILHGIDFKVNKLSARQYRPDRIVPSS